MHPELFTVPILDVTIKTYGFFLMVGFLSGVWLAMRRAQRLKANPDVILDMAFVSLIFGVLGARLFYVVHYWKAQFAGAASPFWAVVDITQGGLEFLGGLLGAAAALIAYSLYKKISLRLYLDIAAPSAMWGLALGRIGCFFNGCCFGAVCALGPAHTAAFPWAVQFPYGSRPYWEHWENREVTVPAELITTHHDRLEPSLIPPQTLSMSVKRRNTSVRRAAKLEDQFKLAKDAAPDAPETRALESALQTAKSKRQKSLAEQLPLRMAQQFPSRIEPGRPTSASELEALAFADRSLPVHPTQLYSSIHAFLLSLLLATMLYHRKRHGVVIGALFVLYPIPRFILELIRADNPHDVGGLTISQSVSLGMLVLGAIYLIALYRWYPLRSPVLASDAEPTRPSS